MPALLTLRSVAVLAALVASTAVAAQPDSSAVRPTTRTVTVPLPNGPGVFYYRSGTAGGVTLRSRSGQAAQAAEPVDAERSESPESAVPGRARRVADPGGVSRLDLLALERDLLDAIDRRLARFRDPAATPLVVVPRRTAPAPPVPTPSRAPAPAAPPAPAGPVTVETVERAILDTGLFRTTSVLFEFAKADLLAISTETLDVLADVLRRHPALRIEVGGHTDDRGTDATNDRLSQRRADAVRAYLVGAGVARGRLTAVGYGERQPVAANDSETGRALNRRVEFVVLDSPGADRLPPPTPTP